jgi:peptide-methionine (S)-S-oxide reductase
MKEIIVGGGCFWCVEAVFQLFEGIDEVLPGYAGGDTPNPSYREVCSGQTGHAEVARIRWDDAVMSEEQILHIFFRAHDPTTLNRQGGDVGTQYRSIVLVQSEDQRARVKKVMKEVEEEKVWSDPLVTEVMSLEKFYPAEDYHKNYFAEHSNQPYCNIVIGPKVQKMKQQFPQLIKSQS